MQFRLENTMRKRGESPRRRPPDEIKRTGLNLARPHPPLRNQKAPVPRSPTRSAKILLAEVRISRDRRHRKDNNQVVSAPASVGHTNRGKRNIW